MTPEFLLSVPKVNDRGEEIERPIARRLFDIPPPDPDGDEELLKKRFLCRGGGMILVGQTGAGKSTLALQLAILWATGAPCVGLVPVRHLKSLLIQAENDDGDIAEMREGVVKGLGLDADARQLAMGNTLIHTESVSTSDAFIQCVFEPLIADNRPDLVWIDPALAYLGGDSASQQDVGAFLRNKINPVLQKYGCGCVIVHHTNKPSADKALLMGSDTAYLGTGSAEWANWARAVIALRTTTTPGLYTLTLGKRGARVGWKDAEGARSYERHIKHAEGRITWMDAEPEEIPVKKAGRAPTYTVQDLVGQFTKGDTTTSWQERCRVERGISKSTFHVLLKEALTLRAAVKDGSVWRVDAEWRPGRSSFRAQSGVGSPEVQSSPESVQSEPSPGSSPVRPLRGGTGLD